MQTPAQEAGSQRQGKKRGGKKQAQKVRNSHVSHMTALKPCVKLEGASPFMATVFTLWARRQRNFYLHLLVLYL